MSISLATKGLIFQIGSVGTTNVYVPVVNPDVSTGFIGDVETYTISEDSYSLSKIRTESIKPVISTARDFKPSVKVV